MHGQGALRVPGPPLSSFVCIPQVQEEVDTVPGTPQHLTPGLKQNKKGRGSRSFPFHVVVFDFSKEKKSDGTKVSRVVAQ